ncbi:ABC transporter [Rhodoferax koreense]|uniref:ABC transporter n=1 Tax=Rhodoferax koreensis TaxID=1842727 RepID=A0A1P8JZY4_9BURK|nr:VacJ family lipoprotein [Rhodoferax koreense]APW39319.1 ABC transporter [Rhodoferax koreense]
MKKIARYAASMGALMALLVLSGCATGPDANPRDPLEPFNRGVYKFNDAVDTAVVKPVATAYTKVTPQLVRTGVTNFFSNLSEPWSFINNVLQGKGQAAGDNFGRFVLNTVFGVFGLADPASDIGIERHREDFGQTLGRWGVPSGPYLVLPLLGPSTVRDTAALPVDYTGNPLTYVEDDGARIGLYVLRAVNARANLLRAGNVLDEAALDKYSFNRDVYLQVRRNEVYDGNAPDPDAAAPAGPAPAAPGLKP